MPDNLTIRTKLLVLTAAFSFLFLLLGGYTLAQIYIVRQATEYAHAHSHASYYQGLAHRMQEAIRADVLNASVVASLPEKNEAEQKKTTAALKSHIHTLALSLEKLKASPLRPHVEKPLDNVSALSLSYARQAEKTVYMLFEGSNSGTPAASPALMHSFFSHFDRLDENMELLSSLYEKDRVAQRHLARSDLELAIIVLASLLVTGIVVTTFLMWYVGKNILQRIHAASNTLNRIAHGDLRQSVSRGPADEIGELMGTMEKLQNHLRLSFGSVFDTSRRVILGMETLRATIEEVSTSSSTQINATQNITSTTDALSDSVGKILHQTDSSQSTVHESTSICTTSLAAMTNTLQEMHDVVNTVEHASTQVQHLEASSSKISEIALVIKEIADQTGLLALNAAIEAARAGEQGRGFAVVADEVRKLSERTADSTIQITTMIEEIIVGITEAVATMKTGTERVQQGVKITHDAHEAMSQIFSVNQSLIDLVTEIGVTLREYQASTRLMGHENTDVSAHAEKNRAISHDALVSVGCLQTLAEDLRKLSNDFQLG